MGRERAMLSGMKITSSAMVQAAVRSNGSPIGPVTASARVASAAAVIGELRARSAGHSIV
jgi:hypothetical protein